jgi:hypothetical protein
VALTVAFGIKGDWWVQMTVGIAVFMALLAAIKLGTRRGKGPLSKLAAWIVQR